MCPDPGVCPRGSLFFFPNHRNFDPRFSIAWSPQPSTERRWSGPDTASTTAQGKTTT